MMCLLVQKKNEKCFHEHLSDNTENVELQTHICAKKHKKRYEKRAEWQTDNDTKTKERHMVPYIF